MTAAIDPGTTVRKPVVVGVFTRPDAAERALNALKAGGLTPEQVSVVAKDPGQTADLIEAPPTDGGVLQGTGTWVITGEALGGLGGFILGISAIALPGIGPAVGAGILLATLAGAGLGAVTGGLVGALVVQGVQEDAAREYEQHVGRGSILLSVQARDVEEARQAYHAFNTYGGEAVRAYGVAEELLS
jgi:uncharacterized membrane protein